MSTYTFTIPHDRVHEQTGFTFPRGLKIQRRRDGSPRIPVLRGDDPIGKTVRIDTGAGATTFTVEIGDRHERGYNYGTNHYYAHPVVARGHLLGLNVNALESWTDAELRPATPDRKYPSVPPLPPELDRLRHV